jgi:hypothetical protein
MRRAYHVNDLEVIAYHATPSHMLPTRVLPMYKSRTSGCIVDPVQEREDGKVLYTHWKISREELESYIERGKMVRTTAPYPAKAKHVLWLDDKGREHYEDRDVVKKKFMDAMIETLDVARERISQGLPGYSPSAINAGIAKEYPAGQKKTMKTMKRVRK